VAFAVALGWARRILAFFLRPIVPLLGDHKPIFTELTEPFLLYMKVAFVASIFLAAPFILYQIWAFISPGLYTRERRYAIPFILFATTFFLLGGSFGYYLGFPIACRFLLGIAGDFQPALRISGLFRSRARSSSAWAGLRAATVVTSSRGWDHHAGLPVAHFSTRSSSFSSWRRS